MESLLIGLSLGAAAGVSPGPLLVLVVSSAIRGGWPAGVLAACAPLVSDAVVVATTLLVLDLLPPTALAWIAMLGSAFVLWTGLKTLLEARSVALGPVGDLPAGFARRALGQAALVNLLSPHPWVFWATVLGPLTVTTWRDEPGSAIALVAGFYLTIVGSKAVIGLFVGRTRHRLSARGYRRALYAAGVLLMAAAVALAVEFAPSLRPGP